MAVQNALLGEVSSKLRAVVVLYNETEVKLLCYYDGEISEEDNESISLIHTELIALFDEDNSVDVTAERLDYPQIIPKIGAWVYLRKQPLISEWSENE